MKLPEELEDFLHSTFGQDIINEMANVLLHWGANFVLDRFPFRRVTLDSWL